MPRHSRRFRVRSRSVVEIASRYIPICLTRANYNSLCVLLAFYSEGSLSNAAHRCTRIDRKMLRPLRLQRQASSRYPPHYHPKFQNSNSYPEDLGGEGTIGLKGECQSRMITPVDVNPSSGRRRESGGPWGIRMLAESRCTYLVARSRWTKFRFSRYRMPDAICAAM